MKAPSSEPHVCSTEILCGVHGIPTEFLLPIIQTTHWLGHCELAELKDQTKQIHIVQDLNVRLQREKSASEDHVAVRRSALMQVHTSSTHLKGKEQKGNYSKKQAHF